MNANRESPNPYQAPQSADEPAKPSLSLDEKRLIAKEQTIGFAVLTLICLAGCGVSISIAHWIHQPQANEAWNSVLRNVLDVASVIGGVLFGPAMVACGCQTLFRLGRWWHLSDQIRWQKKEEEEEGVASRRGSRGVNDPPAEPGAFKCTPGGRAHLFNKWKYGVAT
ncbi:hypothetical protein [Aeoliella mucimassa]|uniref:Uncharacterized protein n=1 Tax=Aeoliella mucimassa TaxID=2527972 RepID=A0A518AI20_9BACT|nr:hypothetical protein [Aeoliella mucimassa]QDU54373.1 hypothetical protein Pan181_05540 [Aeoliella mucimassa]